MIRDRKNHKSPNCAYPEGAAAGLLGVQLGGDNVYFGQVVKKPKIGDKLRELNREDIKKTIEIMYRSEILLLIIWICFNLGFGGIL
jgi:adenosylcobinamide-phosphate synthase